MKVSAVLVCLVAFIDSSRFVGTTIKAMAFAAGGDLPQGAGLSHGEKDDVDDSKKDEVLALPPVDPSTEGQIPSIRLGESIRFEQWGPIILNSDGTTRRIANWDQLTEHEKKVTWRRISKRNEERRLALLEQMKEAEGADVSADDKPSQPEL
mmetsp:Transcript_17977/g.48890  ORF Transcript_17977/g.48890 Transcript_17977/m.48890 type:complete len:152 (-) Transcript_17977:347-802(-)